MKTDYIYLKGRYGTTHIVPNKTLAKVFGRSMKIDKIYVKGLYGSTHIVPNKTLAKVFEVIDGKFVCHPFKDNKNQTVLPFDHNMLDMLENITLFEPFELLIKVDQTFLVGQ